MFLELDRISVRYGRGRQARLAVAGVSLRLGAGEIGVLIGPSGCGKTSLLRAIAGLEPLDGGRLRMDGRLLGGDGVHLPPEQRRIGMVFQDYALFPHLSVAENVGFGLAHLGRTERAQRVSDMLDLVGLGHTAARAPHQLSGGQQQRIALARALAPQPQLLLLDEPFSSLDVDLRARLAEEVRGILKQARTTAVFVTHDQMEAFAIGDRVGVMHQGHLAQWAEPYTLYHRPATRFVAQFIGHGVFAPAQILGACDAVDDGQACSARVVTPLGELKDIAECPLPSAYPGGRCDVLLRADDIVHDDASPVRARIERKAFRGSEFLYTLRLASGEEVLAHVPSHHDHQVGEWIGIRAEVDHVVTFEREPAQAAPAPAAALQHV